MGGPSSPGSDITVNRRCLKSSKSFKTKLWCIWTHFALSFKSKIWTKKTKKLSGFHIKIFTTCYILTSTKSPFFCQKLKIFYLSRMAMMTPMNFDIYNDKLPIWNFYKCVKPPMSRTSAITESSCQSLKVS